MKYLLLSYLLLIFLVNTNSNSQTGWVSLNSGTTTYLTSVQFIDANTGFVGGMSGYLAKTTNGGTNWTVLSSGMSGFVRSMDFPNSNTGYICGDNAALMKTTNGGANWSPLTTGASGTFYAVTSPTAQDVYFCNIEGKVFKSTDGGSVWSFAQVYGTSLLSINFPSVQTGYTAGQGGGAYRTTNGGINWIAVNTFTVNNIWDMSFVNNTTGWFNAYYGTARKTFDGGVNIIPDFGYNYNFEGISVVNEMIVYSCGLSGVIMKTIDGGLTCQLQSSGTSEGLNEIFMLNANTGYIAGSGGKILKTTDGGNQPQFLNLLTPNGNGIYKPGDTVEVKWTSNGPVNVSVQYTTDNGSSWNTIAASIPANSFKLNWIVPSAYSSVCKVKVNDLGSSLTDASDYNFTILSSISSLFKVPELLYLKFNNGTLSTPNYAQPGNGTSLAYVMGHTIENGGMYDSALIGGGNTGSTHRVTDSAALYLPSTGWTIGFWISNIMLGASPTNPVYLFGELGSNFRIYYGGSGGIGSTDTAIMLRMTGAVDVRLPVIKGQTLYIHYVWDPVSSTIKAYKNGILAVTVSQASFTGVGNGPVTIGAHTTFASSLSSGMRMDEFRIYSRALSQFEIQGTYNRTLPYFIAVGVNETGGAVPVKYMLYQNYPNPFNPSTKINYSVPKQSHIKLSVFDISGKEVKVIFDGKQEAGNYEAIFDGADFATGIYFYRMEAEGFMESRKMILIK